MSNVSKYDLENYLEEKRIAPYRNLVIGVILVFVFAVGYSLGVQYGKEQATNICNKQKYESRTR